MTPTVRGAERGCRGDFDEAVEVLRLVVQVDRDRLG